jgi:4-hydroxy-3-methylbut-2-enyl diphosphate reductase
MIEHEIVFDNGKKTIKLAAYSGFCFGVKSAVEKALQTAENTEYAGMKKFTWGPIIHNDDVVEELKDKGVQVCSSIEDIDSDSVVIIRSHGVSKKVEDGIRGITEKVVDATCPYVKKIHRLAAEAYDAGRQLIIIGDENHPEVQGINGWCNDSAIIIHTADGVSMIPEGAELTVAAQTTLNQKTWESCISVITERFPDAEIHNTICQATEQRQEACRSLAAESDMMVIIGSKSSSNTQKLYEIAKESCSETFFVENYKYLPLKEVKKYNRIGVTAGASAPERIIEEVIANMSENITNEANEMFDLMEEIEKSLKMPQRGELVKGEVIQVGSREVYVNLGCKKDGVIPKAEIALEPDQDIESLFKVGDEVEAKVLKTDDGDGNILLSRKKVEISEHWDEIIKAYEEKQVIDVKVVREVKGGVIATYKEVSGFIPMSQLNDRYVEKADEFIGKNLTVKVTRVDQKRNKAVFSHKAYLTEEKNKRVAEIWAGLSVGETIEGTVMRFTDYGAFVDIGGIDGLLHISEISWGKLKHPQEALEIGQKVNVKILSMNEEKGKISLGLKQNTPEPWSVINEKYTVGQVVSGKVVQIKEYGAFVELEPGLDGLVHISEIAAKRVTNIADEISVGQVVSAKILEIDETKRRISLSIKETLGTESEEETAAEDAE